MFVSARPAGGSSIFPSETGGGAVFWVVGHKAAAFVDIREADAHVAAINWKKRANRVPPNGERDPVRGTRWLQLT